MAQVRLGGIVAATVADMWRVVDVGSLDDSAATYLRSALPYVQQQFEASAELAAGYYSAFRTMAVGLERYDPDVADTFDRVGLTTSLVVTGVARTKAAIGRGVPYEQAMRVGQYGAAGAAMRWSLKGGRDTLTRNVQNDRRAVAYVRITSGNACDFCEMLADTPMMGSADFEAHDHCSCTAEPSFG